MLIQVNYIYIISLKASKLLKSLLIASTIVLSVPETQTMKETNKTKGCHITNKNSFRRYRTLHYPRLKYLFILEQEVK